MSGTRPSRRSDTRQRIQSVALDLFAEQGYEKTSLREIAERLDVTKAALYYHFKTKEDILSSVFEDMAGPVVELIAWAREQPPTLETKLEVLRRYANNLRDAKPLLRFMQENQATLRDLQIRNTLKDRMIELTGLMVPPEAPLPVRLRAVSALFTVHMGMFGLDSLDASPEDRLTAALEVASELITSAHARVTA